MYTKEGHSGMFQRRMGRHSLLVVGQGCGLQPFAACSAAGEQRNSLARRSGCFFCIALCAIARHSLLVVGQGYGLQPFAACSAALEQRNSLARRSGCFCIALCAIARHSRAGKKKTAAVKGNGCRAPCSLSGFLHHKTPCGKYLRKKYHTMVLPVTQV